MIITLLNPSTDGLEKTFLAQSYNFGVTAIETRNNLEFSANQRILIGEPGLASTEVVTLGSVNANGTSMTISATLYPHEADTPVYLLQWDEAKFYKSTTGINGTYSLLATVNIDFTAEDLSTTYNDNSAAAGYYYKTTVYNSLTAVESAFSDAIPAITGWARNQVGYLIDQVYTELSDANEENFSRDEVMGYMNEVNDDLQMQVVKPYNFLYTREVFARVGGANTISWPTDSLGNNLLWKFDRMDYNYVNSLTNPATNTTTTVPIYDLPYFRNRWIDNSNTPAAPQNLVATATAGGSLSANTTYYYEVTGVYSTLGESGPSVEVSITTTSVNKTASLSWGALAGVGTYNVYRSTSSGGEVLIASGLTNASYTDNGTASTSNTYPPASNLNDIPVAMALNEATQQFDYYPASKTSQNAAWYMYYWQAFVPITTEGQVLQTPTPKIYKHYIEYKYYTKKAVTEPNYLTIAKQHQQDYMLERTRYKSQDRRDVGTGRKFLNESRPYRSFMRR